VKHAVRALSELGEDLVLAPERWLAAPRDDAGVPLSELVTERSERVADLESALVLDTTHAKDGVLDIPAGLRAAGSNAKSSKRACFEGDIVVSRLRPYLRQIAFVHPRALATAGRPIALSSEFYVLAPRAGDIAFLLRFLLSEDVQAILAAAQEGGHHPRVPRSALLSLRVPDAMIAKRKKLSREVSASLDALYAAIDRFQSVLR
jgi:hypothetical protein